MNTIKFRIIKKKDLFYRIGYALCCLCIVYFNLINIGKLTAPSILFDEFGYLATGALFAGRDWSEVISKCSVPYYSYGYGFIISFILRAISTPELAYQVLILLNVMMTCAMLFLSNYVCKAFICNKEFRLIVCGAACFFPGIIHNTQFAWTEILLTFLFWLALALFKKILDGGNVFVSAALGVTVCYIYIVHQRGVGLLGVSVIMIILLYILNIVSKKQLFTFLIVIGTCIFFHMCIKEYVKEFLWTNDYILDEKVYTNDYAGQIQKIKFLFSFEGIKCFVLGILGKLFYFGLCSFFLGFEGIYFTICKSKELIGNILNKKNVSVNHETEYLSLFILLSFASTLIISTIFHIYPSRIDAVMYGRYTDWVVIIFIVMGLYNIKVSGVNLIRFSEYLFSSLIFLLVFNNLIQSYGLWLNFSSCSPITFLYRNIMCNCEVEWVTVMFLISIFLSIGLWRCFLSKKNKTYYLGLIFMILLWIFITNPAIKNDIELSNRKDVKSIVEVIHEENNGGTVYYVLEEGKECLFIACVQYLLGAQEIQVVDIEQLKEIKHGLILLNKNFNIDEIEMECSLIKSLELCDIYKY